MNFKKRVSEVEATIYEYNSNDREDHLETVTIKGTVKDSMFVDEVTAIPEYNSKARKDHLKTITKKVLRKTQSV